MKIGVGAFIDETTAPPDVIGRKCEALGFESIWLPEHPVMPDFQPPQTNVTERVFEKNQVPDWYTRIPDPFVTLMAVAAATTRLRLGTGVCLVPEHEPITLAKTIATLDLFSNGRFLFGIGAGGIREESEAMGVDFRRRWELSAIFLAMNPSCAGGDHAAVYLERATVRWLAELVWFPLQPNGMGLLVSGGPMASLTCLAGARHRAALKDGWNVREPWMHPAGSKRLVLYLSVAFRIIWRRSFSLFGALSMRFRADPRNRWRKSVPAR